MNCVAICKKKPSAVRKHGLTRHNEPRFIIVFHVLKKTRTDKRDYYPKT